MNLSYIINQDDLVQYVLAKKDSCDDSGTAMGKQTTYIYSLHWQYAMCQATIGNSKINTTGRLQDTKYVPQQR